MNQFSQEKRDRPEKQSFLYSFQHFREQLCNGLFNHQKQINKYILPKKGGEREMERNRR